MKECNCSTAHAVNSCRWYWSNQCHKSPDETLCERRRKEVASELIMHLHRVPTRRMEAWLSEAKNEKQTQRINRLLMRAKSEVDG